MEYKYAILVIGKDGKVLTAEGGNTGFKLEDLTETAALNKLGPNGFLIYDIDKHVDGGRTIRLRSEAESI